MFADVAGPSFVFWPVGCGDTTAIVVSETEVVLVDINDKAMADDDDNEHIPVVDELVEKLPKRNGKPYLSCFVLTHPDLDHCRGFADLLKRVTIGEIWHTPRIFREYEDTNELCDDALAFRKEAHRRAQLSIDANGDPGAGNRVRIIGYSELFEPGERYVGFPKRFYTRPGQVIAEVDGVNTADRFNVFVHAPFKDGLADARNETSLAMQVTLGSGRAVVRGLFLGDLSYPTLMQVFEQTHAHQNEAMLLWNVLLAPHHCSKKAMYEPDENGVEQLKDDVLKEFEQSQLGSAYVIASSAAFREKDEKGDNPPHILARSRYEEIVNSGFLCTAEHSSVDEPRPLIITATEAGPVLAGETYQISEAAKTKMDTAIAAARGAAAPPTVKVGFGRNAL